MSVKLISSNTFRSVTQKVIDDLVKNMKSGVKHIFIVPDEFTLSYEKEILSSLKIACSFDVEVMSFSRLAKKALGTRVNKMLNQQTSVLLLKSIIEENFEKLTCFKSIAKTAGYANEIYAVITNIRNSGISVEKLNSTLPKLKGAIKDKTKDIALLYNEYLKKLSKDYTDIGSELEIFSKELENLDFLSSTCFYITDFYILTQVKLDIIRGLFEHSKSVTIGIVDNPSAQNYRIYPRFLIDFVIETTKRKGIEFEREDFKEKLNPASLIVAEKLFSYNINSYDVNIEQFYSLWHAQDLEGEVKNTAIKIRELIVLHNYRYKDIAVVCSDAEKYGSCIGRIFKNYDISYYLDKKMQLSNTPIIKILKCAIAVLEENFNRTEVINYAKKLNLIIDNAKLCDFENYILKYNINYNYFLSEFFIEDSYLKGAEEVRKYIVESIRIFLCPCEKVSDGIELLGEFYNYLHINEQIERLCKIADLQEAKAFEQISEKIQTACEQAKAIMGEKNMDCISVLNLMLAMFESIKISTVPSFIDSVFVGMGTESRYSDCRAMFVLGADSYPHDGSDSGIIASKDCLEWEKCGVVVFPQIKEKCLLEKFLLTQLLLKPTDFLYLSYTLEEQKTLTPLITSLKKLLMLNSNPYIGVENDNCMSISDYASKIGTYDNAEKEFLNYIGEKTTGWQDGNSDVFNYLYTLIKSENLDYLLKNLDESYKIEKNDLSFKEKNGKIYCKVSALEQYFKCPFSYYLQHSIRVKVREVGTETVADVGSFLHRILELYYCENKTVVEKEKLIKMVTKICNKVFLEDKFLLLLKSNEEAIVKNQLLDRSIFLIQCLNENLKRTDFLPTYQELAFGMGGLPAIELNVSDKKYYFRGVIDRVDKFLDNAILIDYKSSSKVDFSVKEIYYGLRVQLFLYLSAINTLNLKPVGVFYLPIPYKYLAESDSKERYKFSGFITDNESIVNHMDKMFLSDKGSFLPVKINKKTGEWKFEDKNILSDLKFIAYQNYARQVLSKAIMDIETGYIEPRPIKSACEYCEFENICKRKNDERFIRTMLEVDEDGKME